MATMMSRPQMCLYLQKVSNSGLHALVSSSLCVPQSTNLCPISTNLTWSNACVSLVHAGACILGDFGSALQLGQHTCEHTPTHWPAEFENTSLSLNETSVAVDFFQLTVTLLERTGCFVLTGNPTPAKCRESISRLQNPELSSFVTELLQPQE